LCEQRLTAERFGTVINEAGTFTTSLQEIAHNAVPKTKINSKTLCKPWFTEDCKAAICERKKALRALESSPTAQNLSTFLLLRAKARRTIRSAKSASWQNFVSGLNYRTPIKKAWDMVRKIHGKMPSVSIKHLNFNNTLITDLSEIVNTMAKNFSQNSSSTNYTAKFQQFKTSKEKNLVNFNSNNLEHYNRLFSKQELIEAIHQSTDTAVGSDDIHYQFLKHLPEISLELLLTIFNNIWTGGIFPSIWQEAILIPVLKPGKDDADPNSYRPIALTSCVCKILERMINKRLVYISGIQRLAD